jgi:hypothetical protein
MVSAAENVVAWTLVLAIVAGECWLAWLAGRKCLRRWRGGVLPGRRIALEALGVLFAVLLIAWGAAIVP